MPFPLLIRIISELQLKQQLIEMPLQLVLLGMILVMRGMKLVKLVLQLLVVPIGMILEMLVTLGTLQLKLVLMGMIPGMRKSVQLVMP